MFTLLLVVQILVSISIVTLVLLQQGKGADMGAGFGSGASGTVFGARGSGSFFTRATAILATVFFINCLLIASPLVLHVVRTPDSVVEQIEQQNAQPKAVPQPKTGVAPGQQKSSATGQQAPASEPVAGQPPTEAPAAAGPGTEMPVAGGAPAPAAKAPAGKPEAGKPAASGAAPKASTTPKKKDDDLPE